MRPPAAALKGVGGSSVPPWPPQAAREVASVLSVRPELDSREGSEEGSESERISLVLANEDERAQPAGPRRGSSLRDLKREL